MQCQADKLPVIKHEECLEEATYKIGTSNNGKTFISRKPTWYVCDKHLKEARRVSVTHWNKAIKL